MIRGNQVTAATGLKLVKDERFKLIHVLPVNMSRPPKARFESITVPSADLTNMVAYVCACGEQNVDANSDECGFAVDNDYNSMCQWEGGGDSRCTCTPFVVVWGEGQEEVLTYAGDPASF